jgi:hypothetical protein
MNWGRRYFLFEADGTLKRVCQRVADGLSRGFDSMPQYAGQSLRGVSVFVELENRKPVQIEKIVGEIWHFDDRGSPQGAWAEIAMGGTGHIQKPIQTAA